MSYELINADCLEAMRQMEECSISACVTDPPYGLGEVKDLSGLLTAWMTDADDRQHTGRSGFMNREWDRICPSPRYWKEVFRVMKPGAHLLCFASTRTWDLMSLSIRLAGFENRDTIRHQQGVPSLAWIHAQGFPKGHDVSAAIDRLAGAERETIGRYEGPDGYSRQATAGKRPSGATVYQQAEGIEGWHTPITAPSTEEAKKWSGWNCALKPAWEVILVFRRPLEESSIARQVLKTGTGALAIDKCRVSTSENLNGGAYAQNPTTQGKRRREGGALDSTGRDYQQPTGRWPANLIISHVSGPNGCQRIGTKRVRGTKRPGGKFHENSIYGDHVVKGGNVPSTHTDPDGLEEVESWECVEGCPILELDRQGGSRKSGSRKQGVRSGMGYHGANGDGGPAINGSEGSPARFFQQFHEIDTGPGFLYSPKSSRAERNRGLQGMPEKRSVDDDWVSESRKNAPSCGKTSPQSNFHPCVKPVSLMKWLCKLVGVPGGTILDPFLGSGTTGVACVELGFDFVGIEQDESYLEISRARIAHAGKEESPKPKPSRIPSSPARADKEAFERKEERLRKKEGAVTWVDETQTWEPEQLGLLDEEPIENVL